MTTRRARKAAAALAAIALTTLIPMGGTTAWAADETPSPTPEVTPLEKVNALVQPSVVFLLQTWDGYVYDTFNKQYLNDGNPFELQFQCTGFVVNPNGYIATAGHCVDFKEVQGSFIDTAAQWAIDNGYYSSTSLTADDVVGFGDYRVESEQKRNAADLDIQVGWGASVSGIDTSQVKRARVIDFDGQDKGDVALLKVEETDLNALPIATDAVDVGTDVVSIGYPASVDAVTDPNLTPSFKDGAISSVKTVQGGVLPVYEISAAVSGGMSGGPSVNLDGEVIGVNSFGILGEPQAFNFLRPSSQLAELMAGAGVTNELSDTTQAYRDGLGAYWAGDKAAAVEQLGTVVDDQPTNKLAADYLDKAKALPDPPPPAEKKSSGLPVVAIAVGVGVLAVVGGGLILFLLLRRSRPTAPPTVPGGVAPVPVAPVVGPPSGPPPIPTVVGVSAAPLGFSGGTPAPMPAPMPQASPVPSATATIEPSAVVAPMPAPVPVPVPAPVSTPVSAPEPERDEPHFCGDCGEQVEPGKKFCSSCGSRLT